MLESRIVHDKGNEMPPATNRTQRKRPGDLTGVRGQQLATEAAREHEESKRQVQDALVSDREVKLNTDVDYSTQLRPVVKRPVERVVEVDGEATTEVVVEEVELELPKRRIRVNYPIEDQTFGREVVFAGELNEFGGYIRPPILGGLRNFTFEEGRWYTVDADHADHLANLGYIYE
jgi:hypothetical protein